MVEQQTQFLSELSLRELVEGIGKIVIVMEPSGDVLIGTLKYVHESFKKEVLITVLVGEDQVVWKEQLTRAVFACQ